MERKQIATLAGIFLLGCLILAASVWIRSYMPEPSWDGTPYPIENVNPVDARFAHGYNAALDTLADCLVVAVNLAVLACLSVRLMRDRENKTLLFQTVYDDFVFMLVWIYTSATFRLLKNLAGRIRPYMYFSSPSEKGILEGDFCRSWPSGHSASVFLAVGFFFNWLILRKVKPRFRSILFSLLLVCAIATMTLRIYSGNHFLTDVLSGGILGFAMSTAVFWICHAAAGKSLD